MDTDPKYIPTVYYMVHQGDGHINNTTILRRVSNIQRARNLAKLICPKLPPDWLL